jgi:hypothetical protein
VTSHTKPEAVKPSRNRVSRFVVILAGRIVFTADTLLQASTWRDSHGAGSVYQRVVSDGKGVRA